ncbi:hypothetical protein CCAX7_25550 [Capsulimonas corticalis]|uniref:Uncharacterized protein n=1 Tax=Capsulimonas corticalis TaxID=2219043 RepID=A0A402CVR8_9BACT|nr:hypothetical protein [Capsulimonas corticalis]BDI30504.1 hypothetical protein CCAX7_25550 [Capsulimonas corticalis]
MSSPPWTIFVVQHSHIDLGFTDRQEVITRFHRQFIDQALTLTLSERNAARPAETRFKFTCEGFWAVEQFLAGCGEEKRRRFVKSAQNGAIELTAFYLHLTELLDLGHLRDTLAPAKEFARANDVPLTAAMSCDINGLSWGMADALAENGVRFLSSNINQHHGGYPNGGPLNAFHWEGPAGGRVLVWNGLPYHKANLFGLMGGCNPVGAAGVPGAANMAADDRYVAVTDIGFAERLLPPVLAGLEANGYPYRFLPLMGSGLYTDNSPPTDDYCDLIESWNARHGGEIKIVTATLVEFFAHLEIAAGELPVFRGDWPDWWSDGVASAPVDTLLFRNAQRVKRLAERLDPERRVMTLETSAQIGRKLTLAAEHTFGYSDTSNPKLLSHQVFRRKSKLAVDADEAACSALDDVLRMRGEGEFTSHRPYTYLVINAAGEPCHGLAALAIDSWETRIFEKPFSVVDASGHVYPHQIVPDSRGWQIYLSIALAADEERALTLLPGRANGCSEPHAAPRDFYENAFLRACWSGDAGLTSLVDRESGVELLDVSKGRALGAPVYQLFPGGSRWDAGGFNMAPRRIPRSVIHEGVCRSCAVTADGPVFTTVTAEYSVAGTQSYQTEFRFAHALRRIDVTVRAKKTAEYDPEGLYVAFPFAVSGGVWSLDKPGGWVRPGVDQIPGTCCDYYLVQDGAACVGDPVGLAWTTLDAPLVHIGDTRLWQFQTSLAPEGALYSWLTNNKWECNFPIDCGGNFEFRYAIEAGAHLAQVSSAAARLRANANSFTVIRTGAQTKL